MHADASRYVRMHPDIFEKLVNSLEKSVFHIFGAVFEEVRKKYRHHQVPRNFSLQIHLLSGPSDLWESFKKGTIRMRAKIHVRLC